MGRRAEDLTFDLIDALPAGVEIDFGRNQVPNDVRAYLEARRAT